MHGFIDCQEVREQGQQALLVFLTITLQLSFRFASDAEQLWEGTDDRYKRPLEIATSGLEKIRRFEEKVVDRNASARIHEQSNKLAALLAEFPVHDKTDQPKNSTRPLIDSYS